MFNDDLVNLEYHIPAWPGLSYDVAAGSISVYGFKDENCFQCSPMHLEV